MKLYIENLNLNVIFLVSPAIWVSRQFLLINCVFRRWWYYVSNLVFSPSVILQNGEQKTLIYLDGCAADLGCSLVLRGGGSKTLAQVKKLVRYFIYVSYHLKLESKFLMDEFAMPPPVTKLPSRGGSSKTLAEEDDESCVTGNSHTKPTSCLRRIIWWWIAYLSVCPILRSRHSTGILWFHWLPSPNNVQYILFLIGVAFWTQETPGQYPGLTWSTLDPLVQIAGRLSLNFPPSFHLFQLPWKTCKKSCLFTR